MSCHENLELSCIFMRNCKRRAHSVWNVWLSVFFFKICLLLIRFYFGGVPGVNDKQIRVCFQHILIVSFFFLFSFLSFEACVCVCVCTKITKRSILSGLSMQIEYLLDLRGNRTQNEMNQPRGKKVYTLKK